MLTPIDIWHSAQVIGRHSNSEALIRAAIGRYYYASYHCSHQFFAALPVQSDAGLTTGRHSQLIKRLNSPAPQLSPNQQSASKSIGKALTALRDLRLLADYNLAATVQARHVSDAARHAAAIFALA